MPRTSLTIILATLALLVNGCAPLAITAGAGTGYVATQEQPRSSIESFFSDLGQSIRQTTRRITGGFSGSRPSPSSTASRGFDVNIQRSTLVPTEVQKGEQVTLILRYQITGAPAKGVTIVERSSLSTGGKELTVLKEESSEKENGTWENTLSFAVPESAKPGKYAVTIRISALGKSRTARHSFTVQ